MLLKRTSGEMKDHVNLLSIHVIALKLSPFCPQVAASWFQHAEIHFRLRKVTDPRTKADYMLEMIPEQMFPLIC